MQWVAVQGWMDGPGVDCVPSGAWLAWGARPEMSGGVSLGQLQALLASARVFVLLTKPAPPHPTHQCAGAGAHHDAGGEGRCGC